MRRPAALLITLFAACAIGPAQAWGQQPGYEFGIRFQDVQFAPPNFTGFSFQQPAFRPINATPIQFGGIRFPAYSGQTIRKVTQPRRTPTDRLNTLIATSRGRRDRWETSAPATRRTEGVRISERVAMNPARSGRRSPFGQVAGRPAAQPPARADSRRFAARPRLREDADGSLRERVARNRAPFATLRTADARQGRSTGQSADSAGYRSAHLARGQVSPARSALRTAERPRRFDTAAVR